MLIPLKDVINKYGLDIKGVIQVGAHWAEEHDAFMQLGIKNMVYIEPCYEAFKKMTYKIAPNHAFDGRKYFNYGCTNVNMGTYLSISFLNYACGLEEGEFDMYVAPFNQGQSNSLLKPQLHLQQHPEVVFNSHERVEVKPLDWLIESYIFCVTPKLGRGNKYNLLMMDVQGAEGLVLKGATETLKHIDVIYTEVNRGQTYEGNMEIDEMDEFLQPFGFERVETYWPSPNWTWGDAVYLKNYTV